MEYDENDYIVYYLNWNILEVKSSSIYNYTGMTSVKCQSECPDWSVGKSVPSLTGVAQ